MGFVVWLAPTKKKLFTCIIVRTLKAKTRGNIHINALLHFAIVAMKELKLDTENLWLDCLRFMLSK